MTDGWRKYYRRQLREQQEAYEAKLHEEEIRYKASMLIVTKQNEWLSEQLKDMQTKFRFQAWKIIELEKVSDGLRRQLRSMEELGRGSKAEKNNAETVPDETV